MKILEAKLAKTSNLFYFVYIDRLRYLQVVYVYYVCGILITEHT